MFNKKAAISFLLLSSIGSNEVIKRFVGGVYYSRPSKPRYDSTWDPSIVLAYFKSPPENDSLSMRLLSLKLVMLLALATGQRLQTITLISVENINSSHEEIEIRIPDRIKTSRRGQPMLVLPFFLNIPKVCVASVVISYLERTNSIRSKPKGGLILSYKKPHNVVSSSTVSRWIKEVLHLSEIDIEKFKSHSTRHASTSLAWKKKLGFEVIRKTAGWSAHSKTFTNFYNRPVVCERDSFAICILSV